MLGALLFSMILAPVLASFLFRKGAKEWHNPLMTFLTQIYSNLLGYAIRWHWITVGVAVLSLAGAYGLSQAIGSEFLPHLDEGAIWVRGTLAPSTGPSEGVHLANQARVILASFPEVTVATSQVGRPDDGTDTTGFFNTEYFVDLETEGTMASGIPPAQGGPHRRLEPGAGATSGSDLEFFATDLGQHGGSRQRSQG